MRMFACAMAVPGGKQAASEPPDTGPKGAAGQGCGLQVMPQFVPVPADVMLEVVPAADQPELFAL